MSSENQGLPEVNNDGDDSFVPNDHLDDSGLVLLGGSDLSLKYLTTFLPIMSLLAHRM